MMRMRIRPTPAPADSGSAAAGTHLDCEEYMMLVRHSVHPCRCPLSQAVGRCTLFTAGRAYNSTGHYENEISDLDLYNTFLKYIVLGL